MPQTSKQADPDFIPAEQSPDFIPAGGPQASPTATATPDVGSMVKGQVASMAKDYGKGLAEGVGNTTAGVSDLIHKIPYIGNKIIPDSGLKAFHSMAEPENSMQQAGKATEQVGEYMVPTGLEERTALGAGELLSKTPRLAKMVVPAARMAEQAIETGIRNKVQGGDFKTGAEIGAGATGLGMAGEKIAPKMAETALGVTSRMRGHGKTIGDAALNEINGVRPSTIYKNAGAKIGELNSELEANAAQASREYMAPPKIRGLLQAAPTEVPLGPAPPPADSPLELLHARTLPRANVHEPATTGMAERDLGIAASTIPPRIKQGGYMTSSREIPSPLPPVEGHGVMLTRDPAVANRFVKPPTGKYVPPLRDGAPSTQPALAMIDSEIQKATNQNAGPRLAKLQSLREQLTKRVGTGEAIPGKLTPTQILNLKRGVGDLVNSWTPEEKKGVQPIIQQVYGALDGELDRTVPGSKELNQRMSSLIPVKQRANILQNGAGVGQRVTHRMAAHTGALAGAVAGGAVGYHEGGIPKALEYGGMGLILPEMLTSPTAQMTMARTLKSKVPVRMAAGGASQFDRSNK